jgi:aldehyde:ferredoxin oxidoreductase
VVSKNVATGGVGFSNAGTNLASALRQAGVDHLVVTGRASRPVYLHVDDQSIELRDAAKLWGAGVLETEDQIRSEVGAADVEVGAIGAAGENLVNFAAIIFGGARAAGRCGFGAVMGSKNLKAVAVRGSGKVTVAWPDRFAAVAERTRRKITSSPVAAGLDRYGSLGFVKDMNELCANPVRNWQDDHGDPARIARMVDPFLHELETRKLSCGNCPVRCSHIFEIKDGPYAGLKGEGIQAGVAADWGVNLDVDYAPFVMRAQVLCSELGLDSNSSASVIAWAFECYQRGLLTEADTGGLMLEWGDYRAVEALIEMIAHRTGIGDLLARGVKAASEQLGRGSERYAVHVKGHELWEPMRAFRGWSLGTAVATRGGGHLDGVPNLEFGGWSPEQCEQVFGVPSAADPKVSEGKARVVSYLEKFKALVDCLGICCFVTQFQAPELLDADDLTDLYNAATGETRSPAELLLAGERVHSLGKAFNTLHRGFARDDDYPPQRFFDEPVKTGSRAGAILERHEWDGMLDEYYQEKGWDKRTGWQTRESLAAIGLHDVAEDLSGAGLLA